MYPELQLRRQVCFALYSASRATTAAYRPMLDELGLTYPQYLVMLTLWEREGRSVGEIGDLLDLDSGTLSPLLRRLDAAGFIERRRGGRGDERRVEVHLTEAGRALRERARTIPKRLAACTAMNDAELAILRDTLATLTDALHHAAAS